MSVAFVEKKKCAAVTRAGQPCGQWAMVGTRDQKCIRHTEDTARSAGGVAFHGRTPTCFCDAYPTKHRAGAGDCKSEVTRAVRVHGDPAQMPQEGPSPLPVPQAEDLSFEGIEGPWAMYLGLIATGGRLKQSAAAAGLTVAQVTRRKKTDAAFAEQYALADQLACDAVADAVFGLATGRYGVPSLDAGKWWLANRDPKNWKGDVRSVTVEGSVEHQHVVFDQESAIAEIVALQETWARRVGRQLPQGRVIDTTAEEPPRPARPVKPLPKATGDEIAEGYR